MNKEVLLDDIYKEECKFQIKQDEITFIQTGIETLVEQIVKKVHKNVSVKEWRGVKICEPEFIKVGSFYEGTRNKYPDEFDFIYVFCDLIEELSKSRPVDLIYALDVEFERSFEPVCMFYQIKETLQYKLVETKEIVSNRKEIVSDTKEIVFGGYVKKHGPAHLLKFLYHKESGETRCINVDLVPAARVICSSSDFSEFSQKLIKALGVKLPEKGQYLFVGKHVSFTDSEFHFMKKELTKNHVKVYRILKYLINGHGDNDKLAEILIKHENPAIVYSSYMIKSAVIWHHNECENSTGNIGSCVADVLDKIGKVTVPSSKEKVNVPSSKEKNVTFCLEKGIEQMARMIKSDYTSDLSYTENLLIQKRSLSGCEYSSLILYRMGNRKMFRDELVS